MRFVTNLNKGILGKADPTELWEIITSHIPDEVLLRKDLKILSPACGHANEADVIVRRMAELGRTTAEIKDSIYLIDKYSVFTRDAMRRGYTNVIKADFLNWETDMKFDVILGNPPYQSTDDDGERKSKSTNLWSRFTKKSFDLIKDDGIVALITPSSWASNTVDLLQGKIKLFKDIFVKNNPIAINTHTVADHFPGIGSTFSYFVVEKKDNKGSTKLTDVDGNEIVQDLRGFQNLPKVISKESLSIDKKFSAHMTDNTTCSGQLQNKGCLYSATKTEEFTWEAYHTPSVADAGSTWFTNVKHPNFDKPKIIISISGYFRPYADNGTIGYTDMCLAYILKDGELLSAAEAVFGSKLYKFYLENNKWSGFNPKEIIRSFPVLDFTKNWTDTEIYNYFGLTQSEIDYVEANT
jgi:site-specific DNA-methyltransferase (adenine-specific)